MPASASAAPSVARFVKPGLCSSGLPPACSGKAARAATVAEAWIASPGVRLLSEREKCGLLGQNPKEQGGCSSVGGEAPLKWVSWYAEGGGCENREQIPGKSVKARMFPSD